MTALTNQIGAYTFEDVTGSPVPEQEQVELFSRRGVDGTGSRKIGTRSAPFTLQTTHYVADYAAAKTAAIAYAALVGTSVSVTLQSTSYGSFEVLGFREVERRAAASVVGSIVAGAQVRQVCEWQMRAL
jgi:hypothetical protein